MALHDVRFLSHYACPHCRMQFLFETRQPEATDCPECEAIVEPVESKDTFLDDPALVWC